MPGGGLISGAIGGVLDGMMREIWTGTLALLRAVMGLVGELGSLDVTPGGGAISNELWTTMLSLAAVIAVTLFFAQLTAAAINPRRHMFQAATGPVQYGVALALSVALVAGLLGAADGLSTVILAQGANVTDTAAALDQLGLVDDNNAVKATVLGLLGIIAVVPLAIGYGITLLFRSASILVLVATLPITAAGLTNLATKAWFWRVSRWLLALIFLKPAFALCFALGSGIVAAAGRTAGPAAPPDGVAAAPADGSGVVTLLLGLGIMFVALFAPYALFRLFAFIEPGTQPHQAMMSAFSSATAGLKDTVSGAANADIGSVLSGATGGRFAGGEGSGAGGGAGGGVGGLLPGGGSSGSGEDSKKQQAAMAGMAAATGGASAAAGAAGGAAGGAGASSGAAGGAGSGSGTAGAGAGSNGAARPAATAAGGTNGAGDSDTREDSAGEEETAESMAGAGAAASGGGVGAGGVSGGASGGGVGAGAGGSSGSSGAGSSGSGGSGGGWSVASKAAGAAASVGAMGGGRVGAAAQALGGAASGVGSGAAAIGGATPMPPAPMGGAAGSVGDRGLGDYSGGHLGSGGPRAPIPPQVVHSYRDESFDSEQQYRDENGDGTGDGQRDEDGEGMSGVIR